MNYPSSWSKAHLIEIADIEMGQSPSSKFYNDRGDGLPFFQGKTDFGKLRPTTRKWCSQPNKIVEKDDILLSVRAPVGPTNLAKERSCIGRGLAGIRSIKTFEQKYLLYFFKNIEPWLTTQGTGSTFTAISGGFLRELDVVIAPINEQKRIADKLDAVLARVDACREHLDRIPAILKRFRQSVLAAATSGKLTEDLIDFKEPLKWREIRLDAICHSITDGDHQAPPKAENGIPFITIAAINDGSLRLEKASRFVPIEYFNKLKPEKRAIPGDVLFSVTGSIGIPALVDTKKQFTFQRHIAILRPNNLLVYSKYLYFLLETDNIQQKCIAVATGTAQLTIPLTMLRSMIVKLPSLEEQAKIIQRVESLFNYAEKIKNHYNRTRNRIEQLTPSLLAKAFRGELVPQDPNDEPASALLDRIRAARAAEPVKTRARKMGGHAKKIRKSEVNMLQRHEIKETHLTTLLKERGPLPAEALWSASQLDIDDFYDQLKVEEEQGLLQEQRSAAPESPRLLEVVP